MRQPSRCHPGFANDYRSTRGIIPLRGDSDTLSSVGLLGRPEVGETGPKTPSISMEDRLWRAGWCLAESVALVLLKFSLRCSGKCELPSDLALRGFSLPLVDDPLRLLICTQWVWQDRFARAPTGAPLSTIQVESDRSSTMWALQMDRDEASVSPIRSVDKLLEPGPRDDVDTRTSCEFLGALG